MCNSILFRLNLALVLWLISGQVARLAMKQPGVGAPACSWGETAKLAPGCSMAVQGFAVSGDSAILYAPLVACDKPAYASVGWHGDQQARHTTVDTSPDQRYPGCVARAEGASVETPPIADSTSARSQTIPHLIRLAALRHSVDPARALALSWKESRYTDAVRHERNGSLSIGPMQISTASFPGAESWPLEKRIDAGVKYLALLVKRHGDHAEAVYRFGHRRAR